MHNYDRYNRKRTKITSSGIVLNLDASEKRSYSGSGTAWNDLSGNGNNGTIANSPTFSTDVGGNFAFTSGTQTVTCNDSSTLDCVDNCTIDIWMKLPTNHATTNYAGILDKNTNNENSNYGVSVFKIDGVMAHYFTPNGTLNSYRFGYVNLTEYAQNTWLNNVVVFRKNSTNTDILVYVNNVNKLELLNQVGNLVANTSNLFITGDNGKSIASVKIYNTALTATQIGQNYNATRRRFGL